MNIERMTFDRVLAELDRNEQQYSSGMVYPDFEKMTAETLGCQGGYRIHYCLSCGTEIPPNRHGAKTWSTRKYCIDCQGTTVNAQHRAYYHRRKEVNHD